ncbi:HMG-box, partial [Ramicandelaber brevisporus]
DPNAPKRPLSSYLLFTMDARQNKDLMGDTQGKDIAIKMGELWRNLDEDERQKYVDMHNKLKEDWERDVQAYK